MLLHEADQRRREVQAPEADRGREPERTCQLAATLGKFVAAVLRLLQDPAGFGEERMTVLGQRHFGVVRWASLPPSSRSSSERRSLTTDLGTPRRRAASLIHPASATAVNAVRPSSFIIVRRSRKPVPA